MNQNAETSLSLLDAVRRGDDEIAWQRMFEVYKPLIEKWLRRFSAPNQDIDDLVQDVLTVVVKKIEGFERKSQTGAFRAWLRNTTQNILYQLWRKKKFTPVAHGDSDFQEVLNQLQVETSELSQQWNREYDDYILKSVLKTVQGEFAAQTWDAFKMVAIEGRPSREVAEELGMTINAVFIAKSRIMARVRTFGQHILDVEEANFGIQDLRQQ